MKKLITLMILSGLIFTGAAFGEEDRPVRDGDRQRDGHFRIPRALRGDEDIQASVEAYRSASTEFRTILRDLRVDLEAAGDDGKAAIRKQIHDQLISHRADQRDFRKDVRRIMRELRKERAGADSGEGS